MGLRPLQMATHLCFDTETLGKSPNAVVLTVACVPFEFENPKSFKELVRGGFYVKLSVEDQIKNYGRSIDADTVKWWKDQGADAKKILAPSDMDVPMAKGLRAMSKFISQQNLEEWNSWLWSRGNLFDFGKLESMYADIDEKEPYNGFMQRDIRTMIDCFCGTTTGKIKPMGDRTGFIPHNALHDAANDAATMIEIFQSIANGD